VPTTAKQAFSEYVKQNFYNVKGTDLNIAEKYIFATCPGSGAFFATLK
jgi:hypothetical protein